MHKLMKKNSKPRVSFAVIVDVAVEKKLTDAEANKLMKWLQKYVEMPDHSYDVVPVSLHWLHSRESELSVPVKFRVVEYFN